MNQDLKTQPSTKHVTFVVGGHATGDVDDGPSYAAFTANQSLIDRIGAIAAVCQQHGLTEARMQDGPEWGPAGVAEQLRLQCGEVVVLPGGAFWFVDSPRDLSGSIETMAVELGNLQAAFDAAADNGVVYMGEAEADMLADLYAEDHQTLRLSEERPLEPGEKVFVIPEERLATVLDVYGDGLNGDCGDDGFADGEDQSTQLRTDRLRG